MRYHKIDRQYQARRKLAQKNGRTAEGLKVERREERREKDALRAMVREQM